MIRFGDDLIWRWNTTGHFTVKSAYLQLKGGPKILKRISEIWKIKAPPRMIIFGWLAAQNKILTHDNLQKKGWVMASRCVFCKRKRETVKHIFQDCPYIIKLYRDLKLKKPCQRWPPLQAKFITADAIQTMTSTQKSATVIMQFVVRRERCNRCFTDSQKPTEELMEEIVTNLNFYEKPVRLVRREQQGKE